MSRGMNSFDSGELKMTTSIQTNETSTTLRFTPSTCSCKLNNNSSSLSASIGGYFKLFPKHLPEIATMDLHNWSLALIEVLLPIRRYLECHNGFSDSSPEYQSGCACHVSVEYLESWESSRECFESHHHTTHLAIIFHLDSNHRHS